MKRNVWTVTVHRRDALATDILRVVDTWYRDGLYNVRDVRGERWRFPIADIAMIVETPPVRTKIIGGK